eukprot:scaffold1231_cov79-Isochrysis_galbana.AAC.2
MPFGPVRQLARPRGFIRGCLCGDEVEKRRGCLQGFVLRWIPVEFCLQSASPGLGQGRSLAVFCSLDGDCLHVTGGTPRYRGVPRRARRHFVVGTGTCFHLAGGRPRYRGGPPPCPEQPTTPPSLPCARRAPGGRRWRHPVYPTSGEERV